jgi:hypothetical protein
VVNRVVAVEYDSPLGLELLMLVLVLVLEPRIDR